MAKPCPRLTSIPPIIETQSNESSNPSGPPEVTPTTVDTPLSCEVTRIRPSGGWRAINLAEVWRYRELLFFLTLRDIKLRYKQTALGVAWAVIQPLATMAVFAVFFGKLGKLPSDGQPYALFVLTALLPWQLFAYALTQSSNSLVAEQRLITKVYFPRLIIPVASVLSGLVDFAVAMCLVMIGMAIFGVVPTVAIIALPAFVVFAVFTALAIGLWLSALNVQYRDIRYTIPFLTQFWLFVSPVAYPASMVPEQYRVLYGLNPMAGVIEGTRWALLGTTAPDWGLMAVSAGVVALLLTGGLLYFKRMEKTFADVV
ncbi:MAG: phosphate ABC transporter permease [Planctomycetaceae bacterium]|nr:phosphate ABC transporter permease [Planctomycetaceae bacterium]